MTRQRGNIFLTFVYEIRTQSGHMGVGVGGPEGPPTPTDGSLGVTDPPGNIGPSSVPSWVSSETATGVYTGPPSKNAILGAPRPCTSRISGKSAVPPPGGWPSGGGNRTFFFENRRQQVWLPGTLLKNGRKTEVLYFGAILVQRGPKW